MAFYIDSAASLYFKLSTPVPMLGKAIFFTLSLFGLLELQ